MSLCNLFIKARPPEKISIFNGVRAKVVRVMLKTLFTFINEMFVNGGKPFPPLMSTMHPSTLT
jgi:hypothetical protein